MIETVNGRDAFMQIAGKPTIKLGNMGDWKLQLLEGTRYVVVAQPTGYPEGVLSIESALHYPDARWHSAATMALAWLDDRRRFRVGGFQR
jgi:hypothetical protein